jgi:hypothetical protein
MMNRVGMLFKPYLVEAILRGDKTETRRLWKRCMVKVNGVYDAQTNFSNRSTFAKIRITYVRRERLGNINGDDLRKEGCSSIEEFMKIWGDIYGTWDADVRVFVIGFVLV